MCRPQSKVLKRRVREPFSAVPSALTRFVDVAPGAETPDYSQESLRDKNLPDGPMSLGHDTSGDYMSPGRKPRGNRLGVLKKQPRPYFSCVLPNCLFLPANVVEEFLRDDVPDAFPGTAGTRVRLVVLQIVAVVEGDLFARLQVPGGHNPYSA